MENDCECLPVYVRLNCLFGRSISIQLPVFLSSSFCISQNISKKVAEDSETVKLSLLASDKKSASNVHLQFAATSSVRLLIVFVFFRLQDDSMNYFELLNVI